MVTVLHQAAGRDPYDRDLSDLVGELSTRNETFRILWAAHDVRRHDTGVKAVHHPLVGEVTFTYESMELIADSGLTMFVYTAEPRLEVRERAEPARQLDGDAAREDHHCRSRGTARDKGRAE